MKKNIIFIIIGVFMILLGIIFSINKKIFQQENMNNSTNASEFVYNDSFEIVSITSEKDSIVKFPILKNLQDGNISVSEKYFFSDKYLLKISSYFESGDFTEDDMIESYKTGYELNNNFEFELNIDNFDNVKYASFSGIEKDLNDKTSTYMEYHYFIIKTTNNEFAVILYSIVDKEFSQSFIKKIASEIEVEQK